MCDSPKYRDEPIPYQLTRMEEKLDNIIKFAESVEQRKTSLMKENKWLKTENARMNAVCEQMKTKIENNVKDRKRLEETLGRLRTYLSDAGIQHKNKLQKNSKKEKTTIIEQGKVINEKNKVIKELTQKISSCVCNFNRV